MKMTFISRLAAVLLPVLAFCVPGFAQPQSGVHGEYDPETEIVTDENGYCYKYVEGLKLELCAGGRYSGTVQLPGSLIVGGKEIEVAGIGANAFRDNKAVTEVTWNRDTQYVGPSAFYRSGMYYYWEGRYGLPGYVYPSENYKLFVRQEEVPEWDRTTPLWMFFKHNYAPLTYLEDHLTDESLKWGYHPWLANDKGMQGLYYEMDVPANVKKDMFRGYEAMEVIGLAMDCKFAAFHRFPPFSRWKWGESEQSMSATLEKQMETRYGRTLTQSHYIGHLREEDGRVGIFEFEPKDGEAMIVIAWTQGGKVKATYVQTTNVNPEYGSTWNVDDDGSYGIPELLCIAFDLHDNVILWFNHSAPESKNIFGLRQQGDQLQLFGEEQWYVYVD